MNSTDIKQAIYEAFETAKARNELKQFIKDELLKAVNEERWITIHPHGEDSEDYRRLKLEDGETPKEAIDRVYKKEDNIKDDNPKEVLKANKGKIEKLEKAIEILRDKIQDTNYTLGERKGLITIIKT